MRLLARATLALLAAALGLAAQTAAPVPRAEPQAVEVSSPGGTAQSYRTRGSTTVELRGTERAPAGFASAKIEPRSGYFEIEFRRGAFSGLSAPASLGGDYLTYVLWVVPPGGSAIRAGEVTFDEDRSNSLRITTPAQAFWLMVTAEPDFAVYEPSPAAVLVSQGSEQLGALPGGIVIVIGNQLGRDGEMPQKDRRHPRVFTGNQVGSGQRRHADRHRHPQHLPDRRRGRGDEAHR